MRLAPRLALVLCACTLIHAQSGPATGTPPKTGGAIHGTVKSGNTPLPGVTITAANTLTGKKVITSTGIDGSYALTVPSNGRYVVRAELAAFAAATQEVVINAATVRVQADISMVLLSRVPQEQPQQEARGTQPLANTRRGSQQLTVTGGDLLATDAGAVPELQSGSLEGMPALAGSADAANESLAVAGAMGQTQPLGRDFQDMRERIEEMRSRGEVPPQGPGGMGGPGGVGGFGGRGAGGRGGLGRFNVNRVHGSVFYSFGDSALNASPYSLSGVPVDQPDYGSNRFGVTLGGPLKVPKLFDAGKNTFFFFNVFGTRATTPYVAFSHVPTLLERGGDFSETVYTSGPNKGLPVQIFDPLTNAPFAGNVPITPAAAQILKTFLPSPNQPGQQNFRFADSAQADTTNLAFRIMHSFGPARAGGRGAGGGPGFGFGPGRGRNNINFGLNYSAGTSDQLRPFPNIAGTTHNTGLNAYAGYTLSRGKWTNNLRASFNRARTDTHNLYGGVTDIASALGITGVSSSLGDWGVPGVSFSHYTGLNDVAPLSQRDDTFQILDTVFWTHGKHNWRFGGDYRRLWTMLRNNTNPWGSFVFTGFATAQQAGGLPVAGTGYDFADFLLGYAQQTSIQFSPRQYSFRANAWDLFVQDDWRVRGNLTLQLGLRYEYVGPYSEANNQIVNLDVAPGFTAAAPVFPGRVGINSSLFFPLSLVKPDRNNFAPHVGLAWKLFKDTVLRAGYSVNYNTSQYRNIVRQLAFQPPFSFTQTNIAASTTALTLQNGFPASPGNTITNNYGVDPNYRLGYVQMWNLNIQRELGWNTVLNVGYTGSKGTALDMVRAPNRGPDGLLIAGVEPFLWETSQGSSILHAGSVRVRKRLQKGIAVGATYTFSKSIDNASSIGGGATVVAQNDLDLAAERGLSSFDQRHRLTGDWTIELPFGQGRKWLTSEGALRRAFGDWQWSGSFTVASGTPFTARVLGDFADVARGTNGTLRANVTGQPLTVSNPSILEWFNTAAFTVPLPGTFGDAGRNTIIGPGSMLFNMSLSKTFPMKDVMGFEIRADVTNVFNTPQLTAIDTVVNSPTFGQVISTGPSRRIQMAARFRF